MSSRVKLNILIALLLVASAFTPLVMGISEAQKIMCLKTPGCELPIAYAYESIYYSAKDIVFGTPDKLGYIFSLSCLSAYFAPLLLMPFNRLWQSIGIAIFITPTMYILHNIFTAYYFIYIGSWLLLAAWVILVAQMLFVFWQKLPHNKSLKDAP